MYIIQLYKFREGISSSETPNTRPINISISWLSRSSHVRRLHSRHNVHIKHNGTKFQIFEECFSSQLLHPNNISITLPSTTQKRPKDLKTKLHSTTAIGQCKRRCSAVSPLQRHKQHHPTSVYPHLIRLSQVRILS